MPESFENLRDAVLSRMCAAVAEKKERILEDVASAGIDPRLVKFDIDYRTKEQDHSTFLTAIVSPKFLHHTKVFGDPR